MRNNINEITSNFPENIKLHFLSLNAKNLCEIRLRTMRPAYLYYGTQNGIPLSSHIFTQHEIMSVLSAFCNNSVYAYTDEISQGFITLPGGHRVGICGRCICSGEKITNICEISGLNIRIAREYPSCSSELMAFIKEKDSISNTIIIGAPSSGKTTVLRDIAKNLSAHMKVTVIDERSEIAASRNGVPQFDIGFQTDVYDCCRKDLGMKMALRSMSPDVIITDEIGNKNDISAIYDILNAGTKIIASLHGNDFQSSRRTKGELISLFDKAITIKRYDEKVYFPEKILLKEDTS